MSLFVRGLACVSLAAGCVCLLAAADSYSWAVECEPVEYSPSECEPAHEDNGGSPGGGACAFNSLGRCVPFGLTGCRVTSGFGIALPGRCRLQPVGSEVYTCTEDYGVTVVQLHRWRAYCQEDGGACTCIIEVDHEAGFANVEICDCRQEEV